LFGFGIGVALAIGLAPATAAAQGGPEDEPMPPSLPSDRARSSPPPTTVPPPPPSVPESSPSPVTAVPPPIAPYEGARTSANGSPVLSDDGIATTASAPILPWDGPSPDSYLPTLSGPIGLYRISTAEVGPTNHLRLSLHGEFFQSSSFLVDKDVDRRLLGDFTFGYTVHPNVELFGALLTASNRNTRGVEADRRDPELIKSFGDLVLGAKGQMPLARGANVGFELGLKFLSSVSDLSFSASSTSVWFGPLFTLDLRRLGKGGTPLRVHANLTYYVDNSSHLHDFTGTTVYTQEVASFAYGIAANRFRMGLGLDAPLDSINPSLPVTPFVEYHAEIVTSGADPTFSNYMPPACGTMQYPCKYNRDEHWVTVGTRARVYRGFTLDAGVDIALRSVGYAYGTPLPPYNVVFGMSFPLDIDAFRRPVVVTRTIEKSIGPPPPTEGRVAGTVKSSKGGTPVAGAIIAVSGRPRARVATDPDGSFESAGLPPGPTDLEVSAPGFEPAKLSAVVDPAKLAEIDVSLTPKVQTGNVRGKVADGAGRGIEASLKFLGSDNFEAKSDGSGLFSAALPVGAYKVMAEAPGLPMKEAQLDVIAASDKQMDFVLKNHPVNPDVALTDTAFTLKKPIKLKAGATAIDTKVQPELDSVADILDEHSDIKSLRVEAHWDTSAGPGAKDVTQKQADLIKQYLIKKGVADARVEAVGVGADKPLVPNISPSNKAKNRRVELHIVK
jgi:outer membrane protein OmpA-like peptidoglycan-associated protein